MGNFAMNIGATSILDQTYFDDDDSQDTNDDDETSMDDSMDNSEMSLTQWNWKMTQMKTYMTI